MSSITVIDEICNTFLMQLMKKCKKEIHVQKI